MIRIILIWVNVAFALAQAGASQGQVRSAADRLEGLRRDYRNAEVRLRAGELCGARWADLGDALSIAAQELDADGQGASSSASPRLVELSQELKSAIADCTGSLHDRYLSALQRLRDHLRTLTAPATSSSGSDARLQLLLERLEKLYRRVDGYTTDGWQVMELENELQDIEQRWAGLDPCERVFRPIMARLGSVSIARSFDDLCRVAESRCLYPPHAEMARHALERLVPDTGGPAAEIDQQATAKMREDARTLLELPAGRLQSCLPGAEARLRAILDRFEPRSPPLEPHPAATVVDPETGNEIAWPPEPQSPPDLEIPDAATPGPSPRGFALNVWQSAWGDFSSFEDIVPYLRDNQILEVNLNPGLGMTADSYPEAYSRLKSLVATLRRGGVERINYLYAELNYPIERYADFLNAHPALGIDRIVDDSEFTDHFMGRFQQNRERVESRGVHYSAFITLEGYGNSGVSDEGRHWALRYLEQPILMSYFGCTVNEQLDLLHDYLKLADRLPREPGYVKVAILLGGKSTGREISCEQELDAGAFRSFVNELDRRLRGYRSYAGIVFETNYRLPLYQLARSFSRGAD